MSFSHARVKDLALKRVPPRQIAAICGVHVDKVYSAIRALRTSGVDIPHFAPARPGRKTPVVPFDPEREPPRQLVIGLRLHRLLTEAAEQRGVCPNQLARDLIEAQLLRTAVRHG